MEADRLCTCYHVASLRIYNENEPRQEIAALGHWGSWIAPSAPALAETTVFTPDARRDRTRSLLEEALNGPGYDHGS